MGGEQTATNGPDLAQGMALPELAEGGMLAGHVGEDAVLLVRRGVWVFAAGARRTHYGGRSPRAWWPARRCTARGTTPASAGAAVRRCGHPSSTPSRAGA